MDGFHEVRFPLDVARGAKGGPERATQIVTLASGREVRNSRWQHSRRRWDAGLGVRTFDALAAVVAFFEERRGRLHGFRFRDQLDWKSCAPSLEPTATDEVLGVGDGANRRFQLVRTYGSGASAYRRPIVKPWPGSVLVAVNGVAAAGSAFSCDTATGEISFAQGQAPANGAQVTAGFRFDVPVRFDTDRIEIDLSAFEAGAIPSIPLVEILS